jgi:outer membrane receptor protein involved in Fe transport
MHLKPILSAVIPASFLSFGLWHSTPSLAEETANEAKTVKLKPVQIEADFREADIQQSTSSVTVVTPAEMQERDAQNIEDVIGLMPNVNASSGGATAHYYQIRGMGITEQYYTPVNSSVGVLVDDFDYSQMGAAATMFDVKQVEVLRGPQGTRFGSSALAGLIQVQTNEASYQPSARLEGTVGSHNTYAGGVMLNGPIVKDKLAGRLAVYQYNSDGYMENDYLDKKNTQNRDELTARANLKWDVNERLSLDLKLLHIDIDNGYDAFNFKNGYTTLSDEPGQDTLKSDGVALKADYAVNPFIDMVAAITHINSKSTYSYDGDWANPGYDPSLVTQTDHNERKRNNQTLDLRFLSSEDGRIFNGTTDWVAGFYYLAQDEDYTGGYDYGGYLTPSGYDYKTSSQSLYGQLDHHLTDKWILMAGLRVENYHYDYDGTVSGFSKKSSEVLYGGKLGASYQITPNHLSFITLSRGYKAGGVNDEGRLPSDKPVLYDTETLWNLEGGLNSSMLNNRLNTRLNVFYGQNQDRQIPVSYYDTHGNWMLYTENAPKSTYYGLEGQMDWLIVDDFRFLGSLGLLKSTYTDYTYEEQGQPDLVLDDRETARSPNYTFSIGGEYYLTDHWTLSANIEGKDAYYFSSTQPQKSKAYSLVNSAVTYQRKNWTVIVWGKNLGDTKYATEGFYFNADPKRTDAALYTQQGAPRTYGVTIAYDY